CGQMVRHGSPIWSLWLFGLVCVAVGLWVWNGVGAYFGLGNGQHRIDQRSIVLTLCALVVVGMLGSLLGAPAIHVRREHRAADATAQEEIQSGSQQPVLEKPGK